MENVTDTLARTLGEVLKDRSIRSEHLAKMTGGTVSGRQIRRAINKEQSLTLEKIDAIAKALGVPIEFLLTPREDRDETRRLLAAWAKASPESRQFILTFAEREASR